MKDKISNSKEYVCSFLTEELELGKNMVEQFNAFNLKELSKAEQQILVIRQKCFDGICK